MREEKKINSETIRIIKRVALIILITAFVLPLATIFAYWMLNGRPGISVGTVERQRTLPDEFFAALEHLEGFAADALYMVQMVESIHPIFIVDGWLPDEYETVRDEFLEYAQSDVSKIEFTFAALRYITMMRDGHMSDGLYTKRDDGVWTHVLKSGGSLNVSWTARNGRLFLTDESLRLTDAEVTAIGGIPTSQVLMIVDTHIYAENEFGRQRNYSVFSQYANVIEKAGGEISNNTIMLTLNQNNELITLEFDIGMPSSITLNDLDFIIRYEMIGDVFFIDLCLFFDGEHIKEATKAIKKTVAEGTRKFIIDLRDNQGGNSNVGNKLLKAMGIKVVPHFSAVHHITEATVEHGSIWFLRPFYWLGFNTMRIEPTIAENLNPKDVFVSVLTNEETYSSAKQMAAWVQGGGFGNIIGSPSRNAPNAFGNILSFTLPYSEIGFTISYSQWLRPDINADSEVLWPDIMVYDRDALDVALEYLQYLGE